MRQLPTPTRPPRTQRSRRLRMPRRQRGRRSAAPIDRRTRPDACSRTDGRHDVMRATAQRPLPLHELAPGLALARGGPGRSLNVYLLGDVVVDAGVRWSRRRLAHQLGGRQLAAHVLSHAHFDHAGCSAWLCHTLGVPLWCGEGDAAISSGRVDSHGSPLVNRLQRTLAPVARPPGQPHPGGRRPRRGVCGAGGARPLARRAGILAPAGPGAGLRRRAGQLRPAPQPAAAGAGAGGAVLGRPGKPALGCSAGRAAAPADLLRARLCGHRPGLVHRRRPPTPGSTLVTTHGGLRQARGPMRAHHRRQRRKAEQPAEPRPARPRTGVPVCVRAAGQR
jgi:Metallo-beta-lactamase superfamily